MRLYTERLLPWLVERIMTAPEVLEQRVPSLAAARGRVLEIGFGCGSSLPAYPGDGAVTSVCGLDPNPGMLRRAARCLASAAFPVELLEAPAERIPHVDAAFDTVVSHWTLCSVPDPAAALREVRRVLRPAGRFLFLEHGRADEPGLARWQRRFNPIQRRLAGGCRLDLAVDRLVVEAGLVIDDLARYQARPGPRILTQMYRGSARRGPA